MAWAYSYRLLPAVSIRETTCGMARAAVEQPLGIPSRKSQSFPSVKVGIDLLAQRLTHHKLYRGKTLREKLFHPTTRGVAYPGGEVERIMRQIE